MASPPDLRVSQLTPGVIVVSFDAPTTARLTPSEQEVLELAAQGLSNAEIAARRSSAVRTVANLLARAYKKLGLPSRAAAAVPESRARRPTRR